MKINKKDCCHSVGKVGVHSFSCPTRNEKITIGKKCECRNRVCFAQETPTGIIHICFKCGGIVDVDPNDIVDLGLKVEVLKIFDKECHGCDAPKDSNVPESKGNAWKGSKAGISAMHAWIRKHHGTPSFCENMLCDGKSTSFDWCIKTGKAYSHNRKDYLRMCRRCHRMYDMTPDKLAKAIKNLMWSGGKSKTKLSPANLTDIRKRLKKGETAMSIAKRYSVDESNILLIKHGKIWKSKPSIKVKSKL